MDIVCQKHSKCEAPISVIIDILSNKDHLKYEIISNEFKSLGLNKVKDLATMPIGVASKMALDGDPLVKLYEAMQIFDQQCHELYKTAKSEYKKGNHLKTQEICQELLLYQSDLHVLVLMAASFYQCSEFEKSMKYYQKAQDLYPYCAEVSNGLGINYNKKSQRDVANNLFFDAMNKNIDCMNAWINYANGLALTEQNRERAKNTYSRILTHSPELYTVRNNYGKLLLVLNKVQSAKKEFKFCLHYCDTYSETWNNLGAIYYHLGKMKKANFHFKKAVELKPTHLDAWINFGKTNYELKLYEQAIDAYKNALQLCPDNITALKNLAVTYYIVDNHTLAIETYNKCLECKPSDPEPHFKLALLKYDEKEVAIKHLKKYIEINPQNAEVYKYLGQCYRLQGENKFASEVMMSLGDMYFNRNDQKKAITTYTYALTLNPNCADGYWKVGLAVYELGYLPLALTRYKIAKSLKPSFPNVYIDSALILEKQGALDQAIEYYEMAIIIQPNNENALYNLSILKHKLGFLDEVVELNKRMIKIDSSDPYKHIELANILYKEVGNLNEALIYYENALNIDNTLLDVYLSMGNVYRDLNMNEEAFKCFSVALQIDPMCIISQTNIGSIYKDYDNFNEAIKAYEAVLDIDNDFPDAYCNLVQCLQQICDWSDYEPRINKLKLIVRDQLNNDHVPSLLPHHSLLYSFVSEDLKKIASKYAEKCIKKPYIARKLSQDFYKYTTTTKLSNRRIRVGYVSSDFGHHPITQLMQSIPKLHNRNTFEVFCYSLSPNDSSTSWFKISTESDHFRDISSLNDIDAANQINNDGIHILVNMNGYTKGARNEIFALRPAPVQVLWLGYPGTSGAPFIDYLITDKICSPPVPFYTDFYTEKLAYMDRTVFIGDHKQIFNNLSQRVTNISRNNENIDNEGNYFNESVSINTTTPTMYSVKLLPDSSLQCYTRQMHNLPEDVIVYCNFGQLYKIDPFTFKMWITILKNVPNSVLWLLQFPVDGEKNLRRYATLENIDPSRIIFGGLESKDKHMGRIQLADIFLDTPLCNAHTTCLDALWAGTPVITLPGNAFATRVAASVLTTLGCTETIAKDQDDYIYKATHLGLNKDLLESIRSKIWTLRMESKLFDCKSYTEDLENVYKRIWNNYLIDK